MKVCHVIAGLNTGGAEAMLYKLLSGMDKSKFESTVVSLTDTGEMGQKFADLGIVVHEVGMRGRWLTPIDCLRLAYRIRSISPQLVQTWMYHADLIGGVVARLVSNAPVVWGIQNGSLDPKHSRRSTMWIADACARLSGWIPEGIICCAEAAQQVHVELGYAESKIVVIPNAVEPEVFRPDSCARRSIRQELGIREDSVLIGQVARFDPQKDYHNFVRAADDLYRRFSNVEFVLCGEGITLQNAELVSWIRETVVPWERLHLLGRRDDVQRLTAALDIASLSSSSEGCPNVLVEAMSCEIPCVVTDVGDSALLVGETGIVVSPGNYTALADAWYTLATMEKEQRRKMGKLARRRVIQNFALDSITERYESFYQEIVNKSKD